EDHDLDIEVLGTRRRRSFHEAGFEDQRRGGVPNQCWELLRLFATHRGGLARRAGRANPRPAGAWLPRANNKMRPQLRAPLGLEDDPFHRPTKQRGYGARFRIALARSDRFPTPHGLRWDQVTIRELDEHTIEVRVGTDDVFTVPVQSEAEAAPLSWEAAQRS